MIAVPSQRMKARVTISIAAALLTMAGGFFFSAPASAVTAEQLLEVLRKKGVITDEEYEILSGKKEGEKMPPSPDAPPAAAVKEEPKPTATPVAESKSKDEITAKFKDGITWESTDKSTSIGLRGRVEADYRAFLGDDALGADTWDIRRAYLAVEGRFYDDIDFRVRMNFADLAGPTASVCTAVGTNPSGAPVCTSTATVAATTTTHLDEAWLNLGWWKAAQIRFGQYKMPFSFEQNSSDIFTDFQERSMGDALAPGKERGVMVHGTPLKGLYYGIGYSNGQGRSANDTNEIVDGKDWVSRISVNLAEMMKWNNAVIHFGTSYSTGTIPVAAAPTGRTEARGIQFFRPSAFTGDDVDRTRYGLESVLAWGPLKLQSEFFRANFDGTSSGGTGYSRDIDAYYANLTWLVTGERYADSFRGDKLGRIRPKNNFAPGKTCCGAWELGLRYSKFDAGDFTSTNQIGTGVIPATGTSVAEAWTVGVKWIVNPNTRFLLNYIRTDFGNTITVTPSAPGKPTQTDKESAITFRGQFDF
jgi:phosphate-selective porin OprO and OprP